MKKIRISFKPNIYDFSTLLLVVRHRQLWAKHGEEITKAFTTVTGASFKRGVTVRISINDLANSENDAFEWSHSGVTGRRAVLLCYYNSSILDTEILWQLMHELGHRLLGQHKLFIDAKRLGISYEEEVYESHRILFSFLIDTILQAFDKETSLQLLRRARDEYTAQQSETKNKPYYKAWVWAEGLTPLLRRSMTRKVFDEKTLFLPDEKTTGGNN